MFHYSNRYRSGAFNFALVNSWRSEGESYYRKYCINLADGEKVWLDDDEFYRFEKEFRVFNVKGEKE